MDTPQDRFYSPARINAWFAVSSVLTLAGVVAAVLADHYDRDWKRYQAAFFAMEKDSAERKLALKDPSLQKDPEVWSRAKRLVLEDADSVPAPIDWKTARVLAEKPFLDGMDAARAGKGPAETAALAAALYADAAAALRTEELVGRAAALRVEIKKTEDLRFEQEAYQRALKSEVDALRFQRDEAVAHLDPRIGDEQVPEEPEAKRRTEAYDAKASAETKVKAEMERFAAQKEVLAKSLQKLLAPVVALETRAGRLWEEAGVGPAERKLASFRWEGFREAPFLPPLAPVLKIQQTVLPDLTQDYNFARVPRVDRCVSCHMGIDKVRVDPKTGEVTPVFGEKDAQGREIPRLFRTHPRPELYVASVSKHPLGKMGCTVCHEGNGWGVSDFNAPYHTPGDKQQQEKWEHELGWSQHRHREGWDYPMLPLRHVEASCFKCHRDVERLDPLEKFGKEIPSAPKWNRGMRLFEQSGCYGCHKVDGWVVEGLDKGIAELKDKDPHAHGEALAQSIRRAGPALFRVSSKWVTKERAFQWIWDPKSLRETTRMPRIFGQRNNAGVDLLTGRDYDTRTMTEVRGIVEYLWSVAEKLELPDPPVPGDAARGKELFGGRGTVGCVACHSTKDFPNPEAPGTVNDFAPELSTVGSKTSEKWIYKWLKDPSHVWPGTRMPSLRLTDQEAADLAAYLVALSDPEWEARAKRNFAEADARAGAGGEGKEKRARSMAEALAAEALRAGGMPEPDADARSASLAPEERLEIVGKRAIARYGCFGCHEIKGLEGAERIGTELGGGEGWGSKDVDRLDFGLLENEHAASRYAKDHVGRWPEARLPHRKAEWATLKLLDPRIYDSGITKAPDEKLRMPNFRFTPEEADALVTFLLSLQRGEVPPAKRKMLTDRELAAEKMRWIARQYNCYGCHTVDRVDGPAGPDGKPRLVARGRDVRPWLDPEDPGVWPPTLGGEGVHLTVEGNFADGEKGAEARAEAIDRALKKEQTYGSPGWFYGQGSRGEGFKVRPAWFYGFLRDPGAEVLRPWLAIRMPTFPFTGEQLNRVVHGFAAVDAVPFPFEEPQIEPLKGSDARDAAEVFTGLDCLACHPAKGSPAKPGKPGLAPDFSLAARRLRYDWIVEWLHDPKNLQPGTRMTAFWAGNEDGTLMLPTGKWRTRKYFGGNKDPHVEMRKVAAHVLTLGAEPK